ncbi:MAG: hypothetical protein MH321_14730 [Leptospiraceae bacterium]|nr:hypothetical protein [Leptospiraceae bacterium]
MIQKEDFEFKAIEELQNILYSDKSSIEYLQFISHPHLDAIDAVSWKQDEKLSKRLSFLQYGYGARTKMTLEQFFPQTKTSLPEKDWNMLGLEYSESIASKFSNINELGLDFPEFLENKKVNSLSIECSLIERLCFYSGISARETPISLETFSMLDDESQFKLRNDLQVYKGKLDIDLDVWQLRNSIHYYLIYRDIFSYPQAPIFIKKLETKIFEILHFISTKTNQSANLLLLQENFEQEEISQALYFCLQNHFLVAKQN